jgi:hypothetical protein
MAINFPDSPTSGDIYTVNGKKWQWNGTTWDVLAAVGSTTSIADADSDTKIVLEKTSDEDIIHFDVAGVEKAYIDSSGLNVSGDLSVSGSIAGVEDKSPMIMLLMGV